MNTNRKPHAGQRSRTATKSNRNDNEAVARAVLEAFARWLSPSNSHRRGIPFRRAIHYFAVAFHVRVLI